MTKLIDVSTPTEARNRLAIARDKAIAAGLLDVVQDADRRMMIAVGLAIATLEKAVSDAGVATALSAIVAGLDAVATESPRPIPAPRRPGILGKPPAQPKAPARRYTGPDEMDREIPV